MWPMRHLRARIMTPAKRTKTIMFTADWCAPCRAVKRMLAKPENAALLKRVEFVDIDTDEGGKLADKHDVKAIPTFLSPSGEIHLGPMNKRELRLWMGL